MCANKALKHMQARMHARTPLKDIRHTIRSEKSEVEWEIDGIRLCGVIWCGCVELSSWRDCDDSQENDCSTYVYIRRLLSTPFKIYGIIWELQEKKRNQEETSLSGAVCELVDWKYEQNVCVCLRCACMQSQGILALYSLVEFWACAHLWCWKLLNDVAKRNNKL